MVFNGILVFGGIQWFQMVLDGLSESVRSCQNVTRPSEMEVYHRGHQERKWLQMAMWNDLNRGVEENEKT